MSHSGLLSLSVLCMVIMIANNAFGESWVLSNEDTHLKLKIKDSHLYVEEIGCVSSPHPWLTKESQVELFPTVWVGGQEVHPAWTFQSGIRDENLGTLTLIFEDNQAGQMVLLSIWRARSGPGPIEHWLEITNRTGKTVTLPQQDSLSLSGLKPGNQAELWWIKRGGSNASTQGGTFSEPVTEKTDLNLASNCEDGASPVPWLAVQVGEKEGLYVGWEFSGLGRIQTKSIEEAGLEIRVGNLLEFKTDVEPGETLIVPPAFIGCYQGGLDEEAYSLHRWILKHLRPPVPEGIPDPTLAYNLYLDAGGNKASEEDVLRSAAFCHDIGFETFMPDAMWFPECGDWRWDPARFPNGIKPIEEFVHGHGMKLALWCAWTNGGVSSDPGALSVRGPVAHPEWFSEDFKPDWQPGPFYGGRVCLGCKEAQEWEQAKTHWLVSNHKLDYLKHDCGPITNNCNKTGHRHRYGVDASYWATMGYYEIMKGLRKDFPGLLLENCSGGGHLKDFGAIQLTHYTVTTDTLSNLPDRQSLYDSTFAFPPVLLQAYTYERAYKVPGDDPNHFLWRSAMMGAWQIDPTDTRIWNEEEKQSALQDAKVYKEWVRPMLADVKVHHILPRPDGIHWDGMFYWSPSLKRGTLYIFRPDAEEPTKAVTLKGLNPTQQYRVWSEDGSVSETHRKGSELMTQGIEIQLSNRYSSDLVYIEEVSVK
jgi:hypothetical protein